ncbi:hypothetical protein, partial [Corynebacterium glyciniphilum]|uniref:hypothetical protein n=1 Tax=Corynebacterium glyciniphilum TaxID=1404244 RepID=UPI001C92D263
VEVDGWERESVDERVVGDVVGRGGGVGELRARCRDEVVTGRVDGGEGVGVGECGSRGDVGGDGEELGRVGVGMVEAVE